MRWSKWLGAVVGLALSVLVAATSAAAGDAAKLKSVAIQGQPVVGTTLQAVVVAEGDPAPGIDYRWLRCDAHGKKCEPADGTEAGYAVSAADVGSTLRVAVKVTNSLGTDEGVSAATDVVGGADPPEDPAPDPPTPHPPPTTPTPQPPSTPSQPTPAPQPATPVANPAPSDQLPAGSNPLGPGATPTVAHYLRPFPIVRLKGASVRGGAYVDVLSVTAPRTAKVSVSCRGQRCPARRLSARPGRIRQFERFLPAGLAVTIRVTRAGYIGKYVRFVVRSHAAPSRRDRCLLPGRIRPVGCPR